MLSLKMGWRAKGASAPAPAPARKRSSGAPLLLVLALILAGVFFGGLIGVGGGVVALALVLLVGLVAVLLLSGALGAIRFGGEGVFWSMVGVVIGALCLELVSPVRLRSLTTVMLLSLAYLAWRGLRYFMAESRLGKALPVLFGIFFLWGVLGAIHPHPHWKGVAYQIMYNLKLPIMFALGFTVVFSEKSERRFWLLLQCLIGYALLMTAFQLAAPGLYAAVARGASAPAGNNPFIHALPLMTGPFAHPGVLAFLSSFMLCLFLIRQMARQGRPLANYLCMAGTVVLMLAAGERQEAFDAVIVCAVLLYISRSTYSLPRLLVGGLGCAALGVALLFVLGTDKLVELLVQFGIMPSPGALDTPRAILYNDAFYLAKWQFPFGTGFGTYGGEASRLFDRSIYEMLGYEHRYWWYRQSLFLLDTYWPNLVAEAGFIGGGMVFVFALCTAMYALREAWSATHVRAQMLWRIALAGQLLALGNSFTSPAYGDPNAVAIPFLFFGIAFVYSRRVQAGTADGAAASALAPSGVVHDRKS